MVEIGAYLKEQRKRCGITLNTVHERTGITDSRLSRLERGEGNSLEAGELRKLACIYRIPVVHLFVIAGYLEESDLQDYQYGFLNAHLLSDEERANIQTQINLLTKERSK